MLTTTQNATDEKVLQLLGCGIAPETVASACGITVSRVSQLVSDPDFAAKVAELRFANLTAHNTRDSKYDEMEDSLLERLEFLLPLMTKPMEVLKSIQVINAAKRRGQQAPTSLTQQTNLVQVNLPSIIVNKYTTNIQNQVIQAGDQELLTIQSGALLKQVKGDQYDALPQGNATDNSDRSTSGNPEKAITA